MGKTFRPWDVDQGQLFPPAAKDLVPSGHLAHFIRDLVREELDLAEIYAHYDELRGCPPYHPAMMTALLLYGYSRGIYSSRRIEQAYDEEALEDAGRHAATRTGGGGERREASVNSSSEACGTWPCSGPSLYGTQSFEAVRRPELKGTGGAPS